MTSTQRKPAPAPLAPAAATATPDARPAGPRVLMYTTWDEPCGIAGYSASLRAALERAGATVDVFPVDRPTMRGLTPAGVRRRLAAFAERAAGYDLTHVQHEFSFFTPGWDWANANANFFHLMGDLRRRGVPAAVTFHTRPHFLPAPASRAWEVLRWGKRLVTGKRINWRATQHLGPKTDGVRAIVHQHSTRQTFVNAGVDDRLIRVVPMGVDPRSDVVHTVPAAEAKRRLGLPTDCVLLSLFGFIARYKGPLVAVEALKLLPKNYVLAVVGGPHPESLDRTLNRMLAMWRGEDPARLRVTGYVTAETVDLYHAATDVCLAPYTDHRLASSAALTWALSSGKPVIAGNIPSFKEIRDEAKCVLLATPRCPDELAWHVRRVTEDAALRDELVRNAAAYVAGCSWDAVAAKTLGVYRELVPAAAGTSATFAARVAAGGRAA